MLSLLPVIISCCGEEAGPTGEVNGVCWKLMGAIVVGATIVIGWLARRLQAVEARNETLHDDRLADRDKFQAQMAAFIQNLKQKRGSSP